MTHLRKITLEELERRNYTETTTRAYLHAIEDFARHFNRPPDQLGPEEIREFTAHMFRVRKLADNTVGQRVAALRFFFTKTLKRAWNIEETPYPKRRIQLPVILEPGRSRPLDRGRIQPVSPHHPDDALRHRSAASRIGAPQDHRYRQRAHGGPCSGRQGTQRSRCHAQPEPAGRTAATLSQSAP